MSSTATILVVEDNREVRSFIQENLSPHYDVVVAGDEETGWAQVQELDPDVLVSEATLSEGEEQTLCQRVKDQDDIPVILMQEEQNGSAEMIDHADATVSKPFQMSVLRRKVNACLPFQTGVSGTEQSSEFMSAVLQCIERQLHDPDFTVQELADAMSLSRRHLTRRVKAATDKTPAVLIRERRIERAKEKLEKAPETIADVAKAVGFQSPSHFSQVFSDHVGCVPSAYLRRQAS